jgi:hypothetical protein
VIGHDGLGFQFYGRNFLAELQPSMKERISGRCSYYLAVFYPGEQIATGLGYQGYHVIALFLVIVAEEPSVVHRTSVCYRFSVTSPERKTGG